jgi:peptidylprolyl isomerase
MSTTSRKKTLAFSFGLVLLGGGLVACGDSGTTSDTVAVSDTSASVDESSDSEVAAQTEEPKVSLPKTLPTTLVVTDLKEGTGDPAENGDILSVHYVGVLSEDGTRFDGNFGGSPFTLTLGKGGVIQGWDEGLVGIKSGGLRQLDIPSDLAYGEQGSGSVIKPGAALTFVVEAVSIVPGTKPEDAPKITVEGASPVATMQSADLVVGTGDEAKDGATVNVHIIAYRGDTGEEISSSWVDGMPATISLVEGGSLPGLLKGIPGMKVGGRRQLTVPFMDAFGEEGRSEIKLPAKTDLVVVLDLLSVS